MNIASIKAPGDVVMVPSRTELDAIAARRADYLQKHYEGLPRFAALKLARRSMLQDWEYSPHAALLKWRREDSSGPTASREARRLLKARAVRLANRNGALAAINERLTADLAAAGIDFETLRDYRHEMALKR